MNIYQLIRRIHLFAGLILLCWMIMYFATGLALIHEDWIGNSDPVKTVQQGKVALVVAPNDPQFWDSIENTFGIRGQRGESKDAGNGKWQAHWSRPGTEYEVEVEIASGAVQITKLDNGPRHVLVRLHRMHGYSGSLLYKVYALFLDLSALAMILFSLSGLYLWYVSTPRKLPGVICLILSFGFTAATIYHFMTHP